MGLFGTCQRWGLGMDVLQSCVGLFSISLCYLLSRSVFPGIFLRLVDKGICIREER